MEFVSKEPQIGDQLMVRRAFYEHHGIYIGANKVIQFGTSDIKIKDPVAEVVAKYTNSRPTPELDQIMKEASVMEVTLEEFLGKGELKVAKYTEEELKERRSPEEIVMYAISKLGTTGYDIINYNCEHFSNECAFGKAISYQVENYKNNPMLLLGLMMGF